MIPLRATVRLQLHAQFGFADVQRQLPYFAALGVSHLYLSPIGEAMPESTHGYDGIDPGRISTVLGGEAGFTALAAAARAAGLGIILDIVPNHLAADVANPWWADVLRHGRRSTHADWFDIDWEAPGCEGRLWLPVLDRPLPQALADGVLTVSVEDETCWLEHHGQRWPLASSSLSARQDGDGREAALAEAGRCNAEPSRLQALLDAQAYRLAWWRTGGDQINYRRFFDINGLVALRVERDEVFDAVHALPLRLVAEGWVDGVRIDHVDGLATPAAYLRRLRSALDEAGRPRGLAPGSITLHVEKILAPDEPLDLRWACDGSTGYDFMDQVAALLHDPAGARLLDQQWQQVSNGAPAFTAMQQQVRSGLLRGSLRSDFQRCQRALQECAAADPAALDITGAMIGRALAALLVCFPVYRTYGLDDATQLANWRQAVTAAQTLLDGGDRHALQAVQRWLLQGPEAMPDGCRQARLRFEQLCAPLNAKAVEDTAFYRFGRLLSRNEVGSEPAQLSLQADAFVALAVQRGEQHPRALLALATHDHKRGPDARMRLAVLSAWPQAWVDAVHGWQAQCHALGRPSPLPAGETYMLWQALLASWPLPGEPAGECYAERIQQWLRKALREGKQVSSWADPDEALEGAAEHWLHWVCCQQDAAPLRAAIDRWLARLSPAAARLSLAQLVLQLTMPGVPDLYQGNEGWDTSLVDPDNRRPVDYAQRQAWLADGRDWGQLLRHWHDGAPKARLLRRLLQLRKAQPALFALGQLRALHSRDGVLVFLREHLGHRLLVAAHLRAMEVPGPGLVDAGGGYGPLAMPGLPAGPYRNVLDDRQALLGVAGEVDAGILFAGSPVAVWMQVKEHEDG